MSAEIGVLERQRDEAVDKARKSVLAGDLEAGRTYRAEAERLTESLRELNALKSLEAQTGGIAMRRPPLPGTTGAEEEVAISAAKAAYVARFGTLEGSIKGILTDLHGAEYEGLYWQQRAAFKTYLRRGDNGLDRTQFGLLKQIVLTPTFVKGAIQQGMDSVAAIKSTMVEAIDTLGGFAVPVDFQARVLERLAGETIVRGNASVDNTSRDTVEIPVSTGGTDQYSSAVRVTWVDEKPTAGTAATNLTFGMEQVPVHTVMAETGLSRNMIEDAAFDIEEFLTRKFAEAAAIDEDNKFILGSGIGCPQGILPGGTNLLGLTERVSGDTDDITWNSLIAMAYAVPRQYRRNAKWIAERATYEEIAKFQDSTSGNYLWTPFQSNGGAAGQPGRLLGYDPLEQEIMPSVAGNAYPLIFGDMAGYQIFDRIGMTVERYLDSTTARQNMVMYVMRRRLGGQVTEPWRFAVLKIATS
jgi:HK97 family phage major capsid protein